MRIMKHLPDDHTRKSLIDMLPKNAVCAEIGVYAGDFSERIMLDTHPKEFHAIDPWKFDQDTNHAYGSRIKDQTFLDDLFVKCSKRLTDLSDSIDTKVIIHRKMSKEASQEFSDEFFDWVYIDGNHFYEFVKQDLDLYVSKVRMGGLIAGDDYNWNGPFGKTVKRAVDEFKQDLRVDLITIKNDQFVFKRVA